MFSFCFVLIWFVMFVRNMCCFCFGLFCDVCCFFFGLVCDVCSKLFCLFWFVLRCWLFKIVFFVCVAMLFLFFLFSVFSFLRFLNGADGIDVL